MNYILCGYETTIFEVYVQLSTEVYVLVRVWLYAVPLFDTIWKK